jgi:hypothetical protein
MRRIKVGDTFKAEGRTFTRLPDDPCPRFECERIRLHCHAIASQKIPAQLFGTEPEWFRQRGFTVEEA